MFRGSHSVSLDAKGRFAIPGKVREQLESMGTNRVVVTLDHQEPCLQVYPPAVWQRIEERLRSVKGNNRRARTVVRLLLGNSAECEWDGNGRILLPASARQFAGLTKECVMMGLSDRLEIWDKTRWDEELEDYFNDPSAFGDLPDELQSFES
ncbi:MAG: division/cell wall cluster transcriptional repressor MraZ [Oceanospirillaceae bacterium]|nr:division/cell wall cluster transcriptional repressor MraZ [Oceanospirillaceae bacterium]|tara:strand:+ start:2446 stop:2901 length:456 start_codon:yes stop_codon:yes gene_type:complete